MKNKYKKKKQNALSALFSGSSENVSIHTENKKSNLTLWERIPMMWRVFLLAFLASILLFLPAIIAGKGIFLLVGDYNSQQIPFYMHAHEAIRSGRVGWDWLTDLGSNFVTSYTFYLLGSPFFWMTIPFPNSWIPYLLGPLLMLKTSLCAAFAYGYLRRHTQTDGAAMLGSFMYAFCGFAIYNIFFNHFHDVMVFFPLLLWSLDKLLEDGQRGIFALAVAASALVNYFFFFGEVVFVVIYYFIRLGYGSFEKSWKKFGLLCLEAVLGVAISMILLLPSVLAIVQNERLENFYSGTNMWFFGKARMLDVITSYILPPQFTSQQVYYDGAATRWTSLSAYLPVFGISGVIAYCANNRRSWLKTLVIVLIIMSVVPILNSAFVAFNASLYMRWFYMLVMMLTLATVKALEELETKELVKYSYVYLALMLGAIAIIWLTPNFDDNVFTKLGLYVTDNIVPLCILNAFAIIGFVFLRLALSRHDISVRKRPFFKSAMALVLAFSVLFGNFYLFWGKSLAYSNGYLINDAIKGAPNVDFGDDEGVFRIDSDNSLSNIGMFWGVPNVHCFHSIVPASIVSFYKFLGEERSVSSKIDESQYALRSLTGVKYYCDRINSSKSFAESHTSSDTLMPGYTYSTTFNNYDIWLNNYALPMAFKYDYYLTTGMAENITTNRRANAMLRGVVITLEQASRLDGTVLEQAENISSADFTKSKYYKDCEKLRANAADSFEIKQDGGFIVKTSYDTKAFVYINVPWEEGWSCTVNGTEAHIERANIGFMAVVVPAGEVTIEFSYQTPGLAVGAIVTLTGILLLAGYYFLPIVCKRAKRKA